MTVIDLLPEFDKAIAEIAGLQPWILPIRPNTTLLSKQVQLVETVEHGEALVAQLNRLSIGAIAIDTEFRFASDAVDLGRRRFWQDPTALQPLILSGAAWVPETDTTITFVFDLRRRELVPIIDRLLRRR